MKSVFLVLSVVQFSRNLLSVLSMVAQIPQTDRQLYFLSLSLTILFVGTLRVYTQWGRGDFLICSFMSIFLTLTLV